MVANPDESNAKGHSDRIEIGGKANKSVIVPVEDFLDVVSEKTGWTHHALLYEKDIGQVEVRLKIKAKRPLPLKIIKRGKSRNSLYKFVSLEARKWNHDLITTLIEK
ncbi:hypothetical protein C5S39_00060 [Candidatus Methanophagaceae archaeon]|jgi:hypothetical protein|nr:hypothetical protein C5S39_00060 [Methanophagales archaeon]